MGGVGGPNVKWVLDWSVTGVCVAHVPGTDHAPPRWSFYLHVGGIQMGVLKSGHGWQSELLKRDHLFMSCGWLSAAGG